MKSIIFAILCFLVFTASCCGLFGKYTEKIEISVAEKLFSDTANCLVIHMEK